MTWPGALPWPFSLLEQLPHAAVTAAASVFVVALVAFTLLGAYAPASEELLDASALQLTGMFILYTVLLPYMCGLGIGSARRSQRLLEQLGVGEQTVRHQWLGFATAGGVMLGLLNTDILRLPANLAAGLSRLDVALYIGPLVVWTVLIRVLASRVYYALALQRAGSRMPLDLFDLQNTHAFARHGVNDVLLIAGGLAMSPLQALDAQFRFENYSYALAVCIPTAALLLLLPMVGIRNRVRELKRERLEALQAHIAAASREFSDEALSRLNLLLSQAERVRNVHEWPFDVGSSTRLALYVVIVPLAWAGAALMEIVLSALLGGS